MRHLSPIRHPYLFGGGISGALIAAIVAAFISITAISQTQLPGGAQSFLPSHPGSVTVSGGAGVAQTGTSASATGFPFAGLGTAVPPGTLLGTGPASAGTGGFTLSPATGGAPGGAGNGPGNRPGGGHGPIGGASGSPGPGFLTPGQGVN